MDISEIANQNSWWLDRNKIEDSIKIKELGSSTYKWEPRLMKYIWLDKDVIYSIRGPRQVGKTTVIFLMMQKIIQGQNVDSKNVMYYACDLIKDKNALFELLDIYYKWIRVLNNKRIHIFLDEISSVEEWQKGLKYFIDRYGNKEITVVVTSSNSLNIKSNTERMPGRIGERENISTQKVLLPMKFAEYVNMINPELYNHFKQYNLHLNEHRLADFILLATGIIPESAQKLSFLLPQLNQLFDEYLITGGIMFAVNDLKKKGSISHTFYELYLRQIMGDISRLKRDDRIAKQIINSIIKRTCNHFSWNSIKEENDIPAQPTVVQYANILHQMFIVNIYNKIELNGRIKTASDKKVHVSNPFFFNALRYWSTPTADPFNLSINYLYNPENKSKLVEAVVGDHLSRTTYNLYPRDTYDVSDNVFYTTTKKGNEIDFVIRHNSQLLGFDVVYQNDINSEDLIGIRKIKRGCIISKDSLVQKENISVIPVSLFLMYV